MNSYFTYILVGLLLVFSCEQKNTSKNIDFKSNLAELQTKDLNDALIFNFSDTLSKYNKPILFYMWADWCRGCKSLESTMLSDEIFNNLVDKNFKFYKINGDLPYQFHLKDSVYKKQGLMNDFMYAFYKPSEMASYPSFMIISRKQKVETVIPPQFKAKYSEIVAYFVSLSE